MINIETIEKGKFIMRSDVPCRMEVTVTPGGNMVAFLYEGCVDDEAAEPVAVFDTLFGGFGGKT